MSEEDIVGKLQQRVTELERLNTELNARWRADRAALAKMRAEARYWLGDRAGWLFLDGERAQYETANEEAHNV